MSARDRMHVNAMHCILMCFNDPSVDAVWFFPVFFEDCYSIEHNRERESWGEGNEVQNIDTLHHKFNMFSIARLKINIHEMA